MNPPDHGTTDLYVGDLEPPQLHQLDLLLTSAGIPFMVGLGVRTVPTAVAARAEELIEAAARDDGDPAFTGFVDDDPSLVRDQPDAGAVVLGDGPGSIRVLAGTLRRAWAQVLNTILLGCLVSLALAPLVSAVPDVGRTLQFVGYLLVCVVLTGWFGRDLGQLLVKLQVVDEHGEPPGLRRATVRVLVAYGPVIVLTVMSWALYLAGVRAGDEPAWTVLALLSWLAYVGWPIALLVSIAQDDEHQGWHDRVAGTWVVGAPSWGQLGALRRAGPPLGAAAGQERNGITGDRPGPSDDESGADDPMPR